MPPKREDISTGPAARLGFRMEDAAALLAAVVDSSDDAIVTKTLDGVITSWNAAAERLFGFSREEAIGRTIDLIIPTERRGEELRVLSRLRRGEAVEPFETVRVTKSGRRIEVRLNISPIRDASGRIVGASKLARDVSDGRATQRALRESEARFRQLAENAPAAIFIKDRAGRYTLANPLACEALGRPDDVSGLSDHDLLPKDVADALRSRDLDVMSTGRAFEGEENVGDRTYLSVKFPLFDATGETLGVCGVAIDVTDRLTARDALHESEERFRTLADHIAQLAWMADGEGHHFWYNRRWFDFTGTTPVQMEGWGWTSVLHPDHVDRVIAKIRRCFETGEAWEDTFPLRGADGRYRWFLSRAVPIRDAAGRVTRWFGTNTDVTDQREAEEALKEADRRKDEFLATLAHELRNPLAPIRNSLELLRIDEADPETRRRAHAVIDRQTAQLERLVDDLLDVARISRDTLTLRRTTVELADVLQMAVETIRPLAKAEGVELQLHVPPKPLFLAADAARLSQVFSNLLGNACKYSDRGGQVWLEARREGEEAVVCVRDEGCGIAAEMLPRVFDMFTHQEPPTGRSRAGLGIGLGLVKRLVSMHGGSVVAASEGLGRGSEFVVRLPLEEEPSTVVEPHTTQRPPATRPGSGLRILIVDDNVDAADSLATLLEKAGHQTARAYDGEDAIRRAEALRPDVAVLDIGLPGLSGHDVARCIRAQPWGRAVTLVALSGWGQEDDRRLSHEAGFDHHLVKPVDPDALRELLAGTAAR